MTIHARLTLLGTLLVTVACAPASHSTTGSRNQNLITAEEIQTVDAATAMDVVRRLRPNWLRFLGERVGSPVVYLDGGRRGEPSTLAHILIDNVQDIRYLSAPDATQRYGTGHTAGAILVTSKR